MTMPPFPSACLPLLPLPPRETTMEHGRPQTPAPSIAPTALPQGAPA
jgi:hypothetical protein